MTTTLQSLIGAAQAAQVPSTFPASSPASTTIAQQFSINTNETSSFNYSTAQNQDQSNSTITYATFPRGGSPYRLILYIQDYSKPSVTSTLNITSTAAVSLPMPSTLQDNMGVIYTEQAAGTFTGFLVNTLEAAAGGKLTDALVASITGTVESIVGKNLQQTSIGQQILQLNASTPNPFLTVYFNSPAYKRHQFSWILSPDNAQESNDIQNIIQILRSAQLPGISQNSGGSILQYPSIITPVFFPNAQQLYLCRPCVIESMVVDRAPMSIPVFMAKTQSPESIGLTIQLLEIELWTRNNNPQLVSAPTQVTQ